MSNLQIKGVPPAVYDEVRRRASEAGMTLRDYVLDLIRRDLALPSRPEWLESLQRLKAVELERPAAALIEEQRRERATGPSRTRETRRRDRGR